MEVRSIKVSFKLMSVLEEMYTQTVIKREKVKPSQKIVICKPKMNPQRSASGKTSGLAKVLALNPDNLNSVPGTHRGTRQRTQESCPLATQFQVHTQLKSKYIYKISLANTFISDLEELGRSTFMV